MRSLKVAAFTVKATVGQSARWKQAAEMEGHAAVGSWLAKAADRYLDGVLRAGRPVVLAWHRGRFSALLDVGKRELPGFLSPPFGIFRGSEAGPGYKGCRTFSLVYVPHGRILATVGTCGRAKALASDLARLWVRWGGSEPAEDPAPLLQRFQRDDV